MSNGWQLSSEHMVITLTKAQVCIRFNDVQNTPNGSVVGARMILARPPLDVINVGIIVKGTVDINELHRLLGHPGEAIVRATSKHYGWKLRNKLTACENVCWPSVDRRMFRRSLLRVLPLQDCAS